MTPEPPNPVCISFDMCELIDTVFPNAVVAVLFCSMYISHTFIHTFIYT